MSADRITPRVFAKGYGPTNEPRGALLVAFVIAEAGILIAELDLIARVVSMVFLALYGSINVTCAIESWASPDFRPRFKIPKLVSIVGAVSALLLMIQLDLLAMFGATALMLGLFVVLQRRQLTLENGDTWEGVWSTLVRTGLQRLHRSAGERRNWRPNVMLFDEEHHPAHGAIRAFAATLASGNGMVTDFALAPPGEEDARPSPAAGATPAGEPVGVFDVRVETEDPLDTVANLCRYHGFSGVPPNTLLLPWRYHTAHPDGFVRALDAANRRGLNLLLFEEARVPSRTVPRRIDVWWAHEAGNLALSIALTRFITRAPEWEGADVSVLIVGEGGDDDDVLRAKAARYLEASRVDARVRLVHRPHGERLHDLVCNESRIADLVLLGLPEVGEDASHLERLAQVASLPGRVVFLRASAAFADVLTAARRSRASTSERLSPDALAPGATPPAGYHVAPAEVFPLPTHVELARVVRAIAAHRSERLHHLHARIAAAYGVYLDLCAAARELVVRRTDALVAAAHESAATTRRKLAGKATASFLSDAERALTELESSTVAAQATVLGEELAALMAPGAALPASVPAVVSIERPRELFRPRPGDSRALRRWKRWRRWRWFYRRTIPQSIAVGALARRDHERILGDEVSRILARFRTASHDLAVEISRALATVEWKAHAQLSRAELEGANEPSAMLTTRLEASRADALRRLDGIAAHTRERIEEHRAALDSAASEAARRLAKIVDQVNAPRLARAAAKDPVDRSKLARLADTVEAWRDEQLQLLRRAHLGLRLARFRDRLTVASAHALEDLVACVRASGHRACHELRDALGRAEPGTTPELPKELPQDASPLVARLARTAAALTGDLPETETLLTDDAVAALVRGDAASEVASVPVRAAVQAMVETDVLGRLGAEAVRFAEADARAWAVARDTVVLVSAQPRTADEDDDPSAAEGGTVAEAIGRLDGQLTKLREIEDGFAQAVLEGLEAVATATELDGLSTSLEQRGGRARDRERSSYVGALVRRGAAGLRSAAANVIYRRSDGIVYAHRTAAARERSAAQVIRGLVERSSVPPPVLTAVPLYYRNLFLGQININDSFFAGREEEIEAGRAVISGERASGPRTVLVSGPRGAGKTTLCQQIATTGSSVFWVTAPPGGAATPGALRGALAGALGGRGTPAQIVGRLAPGATIVIDDLELWWERRPGGLGAIDELLELVAGAGDRVGFVLAGSAASLRLLGALRPELARVAYTHLECRPLTARTLERVIMARHASTGLDLRLGKRSRETLGAWTRARLFDAHFDHSRGNVGYALRSWIAHVDACEDDVLSIRMPDSLDWDVLDDLRPELVAVLLELVLHKAATTDKLVRVTERSSEDVADAVAELCALGLAVQSRRRVVQLNPYVLVPVIDWLARRELA